MDVVFKIEDYDKFQMAVKELLKQSHTSSLYSNTEIATNVIEAAKVDLHKLLIRSNFDINEVHKQILSCNWDRDRVEQFVSLLEDTKTELFYSVITHYNSAYGDTVTNFMWLLKLVLGTSESKVVRYPLLQLVLSTINSNGQQKQKFYELNKEALFTIINKMESCLGVEGTL